MLAKQLMLLHLFDGGVSGLTLYAVLFLQKNIEEGKVV